MEFEPDEKKTVAERYMVPSYPQQYPPSYPQQYPPSYPQQYPPPYQQPYPIPTGSSYPHTNPAVVAPGKIRTYLIWSILNIVIGGFILGIIAVILSLLVRRSVKRGHFDRAKKLSTITLIWNIFTTILGVAIWIYIIYSVANRSGNRNSG